MFRSCMCVRTLPEQRGLKTFLSFPCVRESEIRDKLLHFICTRTSIIPHVIDVYDVITHFIIAAAVNNDLTTAKVIALLSISTSLRSVMELFT